MALNYLQVKRQIIAEKTDSYDRKVIAKSNHARDRARGIKPMPTQVLVGTKASGIKLPMRPFSKPIDRTTGQAWGQRR